MLSEIAVEAADLAQAAGMLHERYGRLLDRASFYLPFLPGQRNEEWRQAVAANQRLEVRD
jgi:hypothetical protein